MRAPISILFREEDDCFNDEDIKRAQHGSKHNKETDSSDIANSNEEKGSFNSKLIALLKAIKL
jgi:hypothetical protein